MGVTALSPIDDYAQFPIMTHNDLTKPFCHGHGRGQRTENVMLFSNHNESLLRRQPEAIDADTASLHQQNPLSLK